MATQINGSQVNVHMENKNSADLSEIITNIRTQYERAAQKSQEETEAWYQNKVSWRRRPQITSYFASLFIEMIILNPYMSPSSLKTSQLK